MLFLDEIQECPKAIQALRYFYEQIPQLHVVGAESLLKFTLEKEAFSFPVGRVEFMYLQPLSFHEFLMALGHEQLVEYIQSIEWGQPPDAVIHDHLLDLVSQYFIVGGMPRIVKTYVDTSSYIECRRVQSTLLQTYRSGFGKYAKQTQFKYLEQVFAKAPCLVGQHFKYSKIDPTMRARDLKVALEKLCLAGLIHRILKSSGGQIPLGATANHNKFKLLFLDIGLLQQACGLDIDLLTVSKSNDGIIAEQFVGQELLAYHAMYEPNQLYFWERDKKTSFAEVDYLVHANHEVVPVEVKSGTTGRLRSLKLFLQEKHKKVGVRISELPMGFDQSVVSLPFYLVSEMPRLFASKCAEEYENN